MKNFTLLALFLFCLNVFGQLPSSRVNKSNITLKANIGVLNVNEFADGVSLGLEMGRKFNELYEFSTSIQISTNYDQRIKTISSSGDPKTVKLNKTFVYSDLQFISNFNLSYLFSQKEHNYDKVYKNDFVFGIGLGALLTSRVNVGKEDPSSSVGSYSNTGKIGLSPSVAYRFSYIYNFENDLFIGGALWQNIMYDGGAFYLGLQVGVVL